MASTLFVQLESRMRRRAMIDLLDDLTVEARKRAGVAFVTIPNVSTPPGFLPQLLPHSVLPIVPARLLNATRPVIQSDWPGSGSDGN